MSNRRAFFNRLVTAGAGLLAGRAMAQQTHDHSAHAGSAAPAGAPIPVEMPDLPKLPHKMVDGVKEFHLIAEVVRTEFMPGRPVDAWGFNGSVPGPTIEVNEGDRVRVVFENRLPEMTAVHWHGFEVPMEMDGSVGLGQDPVPPGGKYVYEFTLHQNGTFFYHSHFAMQEMMGMLGMFIMHPKQAYDPPVQRDFGIVLQEWALLPNNTVPNTLHQNGTFFYHSHFAMQEMMGMLGMFVMHPKQAYDPPVQRDFGIVLQEWALLPNNTVPNTLSMEFNWLTFNGKSGPATTPMLVRQGERVRIRIINIGMDHHPIHLHGHQFCVTGTEAGRIPRQLWHNENTVIAGVAQARDIEFDAKYVGDWMLHCHLPHHMMNQMMSMVGPVSHGGHGLQTGGSMSEGMGILRQGGALAEENGPALGRGIGLAGDRERAVSNLVAASAQEHAGHVTAKPGDPMEMYPKDDPEKKKVPGYPQDMWMPMDEMFNDKPENHGLRKGWSGAMMGMMTLVRVLPPDVYDKIMELKAKQPAKGGAHEHKH